MKIHHYVIIILLMACAIFLGLNLKNPPEAANTPVPAASPKVTTSRASVNNTALKIIHQRKSVRKYTKKEVSREDLKTLVRAGMAAPTAANRQPWAFVIITDRKTLDALSVKLPFARMLKGAPAAISVVGLPKLGLEGKEQEYWIQDCSAASQNILLAAESMGIGAVWTGVYPVEKRIEAVREILVLPADAVPLNVIVIGYPAGVEKPKNKFKAERIHWQKW